MIEESESPNDETPPDKRLPDLDISNSVEFCAEEAASVHLLLDIKNIPRLSSGMRLSLWGRVLEFVKQQELTNNGHS